MDNLAALEHWIETRYPVETNTGSVASVSGEITLVNIKGVSQPQICSVANDVHPSTGDFCILMRPPNSQRWIVTLTYPDPNKGRTNLKHAVPQHLMGASANANAVRSQNDAITINSTTFTDLISDNITTTGGGLLVSWCGWVEYTGTGFNELCLAFLVDGTYEFIMDNTEGFQFHNTYRPGDALNYTLVIPEARVGIHTITIQAIRNSSGSFSVETTALSISEVK